MYKTKDKCSFFIFHIKPKEGESPVDVIHIDINSRSIIDLSQNFYCIHSVAISLRYRAALFCLWRFLFCLCRLSFILVAACVDNASNSFLFVSWWFPCCSGNGSAWQRSGFRFDNTTSETYQRYNDLLQRPACIVFHNIALSKLITKEFDWHSMSMSIFLITEFPFFLQGGNMDTLSHLSHL